MRLYKNITLVVLFNFSSVQIFFAQKSDKSQIYAKIDKSIENINRLLGSNCKIKYEKEFIATFYENGIPFREDRVYLDALDPHSVHYVEEEKAVSVQCLELKDLQGKWSDYYCKECINREIAKDKKLLFYSRIAFFTDEKNKAELEEELKKLIMLGHELTFK